MPPSRCSSRKKRNINRDDLGLTFTSRGTQKVGAIDMNEVVHVHCRRQPSKPRMSLQQHRVYNAIEGHVEDLMDIGKMITILDSTTTNNAMSRTDILESRITQIRM